MIFPSSNIALVALGVPSSLGFSFLPSSTEIYGLRRDVGRWIPPPSSSRPYTLYSQPSDTGDDYEAFFGSPDDAEPTDSFSRDLVDRAKSILLDCANGVDPDPSEVRRKVGDLEKAGMQAGAGGDPTYGGLLAGEWELLYTEDDVTRSSPFFWAFRKAFPSESDQIFSITDSIPAPVKEIGPAFQTIEVEGDGSRPEGSLISRVKVATLGGVATSIMTTRCTILGGEGRDSLRIRVDSTKPEDSTVLKGLGPLGEFLNDNGPAFPSGDALDKAAPGSAEVVIQTTYCDENLRISRNMMRPDDYFIFIRKSFQGVFDV